MSHALRRHRCFVAISLVGCGLTRSPDSPELGAGGSAGSAGSVGSGGASGLGGSSGGNAGSSAAGGSENGGSSSGGTSILGGSNAGGTSNGGTNVGGSENGGSSAGGSTNEGGTGTEPDAGAAGDDGSGGATGGTGGTGGNDSACTPACDPSMDCVSGACVCPMGQTDCSGQCFDLQNDAEHCGSCTQSCDDGCSAGRCYTRVGAVPDDVIALAVNGTHVYYTARDTGTVGRFPRDGGNAEVVAQGQEDPNALALDANNVYWVNLGDVTTLGTGSVMKRALSGGNPITLATDELSPVFVAVDAGNVYWANYPPQPPTYMKVPIAGGSKSEVASGTALTNAVEFSIDDGYVYWAGWYDTGAVWRVPVSNPNQIESLTTTERYASVARVLGDTVYFLAGGPDVTSTVRQVSTTGGEDTEVTEASAGHMLVDSSGIYLASGSLPDGTRNAILKVSLDGSAVSVLARPPSSAYSLAVSDSDVYWVDEEHVIKKTSKTP